MSDDESMPVHQGDIAHAVDSERRRVMVDISELKSLQEITIRQNARQFWMTLAAVAVAATFIATREAEWKWFKNNTVKTSEFVSWGNRTEKLNRANGIDWESAVLVQSRSDDE